MTGTAATNVNTMNKTCCMPNFRSRVPSVTRARLNVGPCGRARVNEAALLDIWIYLPADAPPMFAEKDRLSLLA